VKDALLCDAAQAVGGKLYVLGGGLNVISASQPSALAFMIAVPWNQSNKKHTLVVELVDSNGKPFPAPSPTGEKPLRINAEFEAGRPAGTSPGSELPFALAIALLAIQFKVGRYEWRFTINGVASDDWKLPFEVKAPPGSSVFYPR
jgi:hypothetical protein